MPRKLRRAKGRHGQVLPVSMLAWALSDGTCGETGGAVAPDVQTARSVWPYYRRAAWAYMHVGKVPMAAQVHDSLTTQGFDVLWGTWQSSAYRLVDVLTALEADRANLQAFARRDPEGANEIGDFLALFKGELDRVEREARRYDSPTLERWHMGAPDLSRGGRYGELIGVSRD